MLNNLKLDWVIAQMPRVSPRAPTCAPAILKAVLQNEGFRCHTIDLNFDLYNRLEKTSPLFWSGLDFTFEDRSKFNSFNENIFASIAQQWAKDLLAIEAEWIGLSMFSRFSEFPTEVLCEEIRKLNSKQKIVVGGPHAQEIGKKWKRRGLIDHFVGGEGERAIVELTKGNLDFPGIDSIAEQLTSSELTNLPNPDYSDFDLAEYPNLSSVSLDPKTFNAQIKPERGQPLIYITGSRGCINKCNFCDVAVYWPKFRARSGKRLAEEIIHQHTAHNCNHFYFTDSLVNGSLKELRDLCLSLIDYYNEVSCEKFNLEGQFVCRSPGVFKDDLYQLMAKAGFAHLFLGVESGSDRVLLDMQKNFSRSDIIHTMQMLHEVKIKAALMLIVGYPKESAEDFLETITLLDEFHQRGIGEGITVCPGSTMLLYKELPIWHELGSELKDYTNSRKWTYGENTKEVRVRRFFQLVNRASELGFNLNLRQAPTLFAEYKETAGAPLELHPKVEEFVQSHI